LTLERRGQHAPRTSIRPLVVVLPGLLAQIDAELANKKMSTAERWRLRLRAGLIRSLLTPRPAT
jgi:hypothetical protein